MPGFRGERKSTLQIFTDFHLKPALCLHEHIAPVASLFLFLLGFASVVFLLCITSGYLGLGTSKRFFAAH